MVRNAWMDGKMERLVVGAYRRHSMPYILWVSLFTLLDFALLCCAVLSCVVGS